MSTFRRLVEPIQELVVGHINEELGASWFRLACTVRSGCGKQSMDICQAHAQRTHTHTKYVQKKFCKVESSKPNQCQTYRCWPWKEFQQRWWYGAGADQFRQEFHLLSCGCRFCYHTPWTWCWGEVRRFQSGASWGPWRGGSLWLGRNEKWKSLNEDVLLQKDSIHHITFTIQYCIKAGEIRTELIHKPWNHTMEMLFGVTGPNFEQHVWVFTGDRKERSKKLLPQKYLLTIPS